MTDVVVTPAAAIPATGAVPDVVASTLITSDWGNNVGAASKGRAVQRFNSAAERDAAITAPVAGMVCYLAATNLFYGYRSGAWALLGTGNPYKAFVYRAAAQSIPASANTAVAMDTALFDPSAMLVSGHLTIPVAGFYTVAFMGSLAAAASGGLQTNLQRNANPLLWGASVINNLTVGPGSAGGAVLQLAANDTLTLGIYQTGPAAANTVTGSIIGTYLSAHLLST